MKKYPSKKIVLNDLNEIDLNALSSDFYFEYKSIHFYFKKGLNFDKLLVSFHGSLQLDKETRKITPTPVFRYYNISTEICSVLCISDKTLEDYAQYRLRLSWYLPISNKPHHRVYEEIINYFNNLHKFTIFTGSSGGGFPAIKYACMFKQGGLVQNSQLYLQKYWYFKKMVETVSPSILVEHDIQEYIIKHGPPKYIRILQNVKDTEHMVDHFVPFKQFIFSTGFQDRFEFEEFLSQPEGLLEHGAILPDNLTYDSLLKQTFQRLGF